MPDAKVRGKKISPLFFKPAEDGKTITCILCPNNCRISPGKFGSCGIRGCSEKLEGLIPYAGRISALASDPIEKKPLYHFYPGTRILSAGFFGCNLKCPFCQNYSISTTADINADYLSPEDAAGYAASSGTTGLAYTYSEPMIHIEWIIETAAIVRKKGLKNVLVTNGYINPVPGEKILENIDALNIDLKSFKSDFYKTELKGRLEPVKDFIQMAAGKAHVEVTTLVIPGKNDSETEIASIASFISSIRKSIPLHLSCYFPSYRYSLPPTEPESVFRLAEIAGRYLDFVYPGNTGMRENSTVCPSCGNILLKRTGYRTKVAGIAPGGKCISCGHASGIII